MDNINIINFWWTKNYGANLTTFALSNILKSIGYFPQIINSSINYFQNDNSIFLKFAKEKFKITKYINDNLDILNKNSFAFITGSDQVFRPIYTRGKMEQFLLDFVKPDAKKIAFSASFGVDKEQFLNENSKDTIEHMKNSLSSFDFISVRERSGVEICKDVFGLDAEWIIDPVFILDKSKYDELINNATQDYSDKIVCYVLDSNDDYNKVYEFLSNKYNKKVVEIAKSNISVENWLSAIKNCEFIVTDSFHGMCFAIIFNKPFICVANKNRGKTRFDSICEMLNIENQCIDNINKIYNEDCIFNPNYDFVNKKIEEEKQKGLDFIDKILNTPVQITQAKKDVRLCYLEKRVAELEERDSLKYQLRKKYLIIHYKLPKFLQKIIDVILKNIKGFINAHRK